MTTSRVQHIHLLLFLKKNLTNRGIGQTFEIFE